MSRCARADAFLLFAALAISAGCSWTGFGFFGSFYSAAAVEGADSVIEAATGAGAVIYPETSARPDDPGSATKSMAIEYSMSTDAANDLMYMQIHVLVDLLRKPGPGEQKWYRPYLRAGIGHQWLDVYVGVDSETMNTLSIVGSAGVEVVWENHIGFFVQAKTSVWLGELSKLIPELFPDPRFGIGLDVSSGLAIRF